MMPNSFLRLAVLISVAVVIFGCAGLIFGSSHFHECAESSGGALTTFSGCFIEEADEAITAFSTFVIAVFTILLGVIALNQTNDTRILRRAYMGAQPSGIHIMTDRTLIAH